jgi:hypothetical protein
MWYAITPDLSVYLPPVPPAIVRVVQPVKPVMPVIRPARKTVQWTPPSLPVAFYQTVRLPAKYKYSERGALRYLAHKLHAEFRFRGPNYALLGLHIPFGKPETLIALLRQIGDAPYIQGTVTVSPKPPFSVAVQNAPLK